MEVKLRNLTRLFVHPTRYEIPRFQRPYVWSRDKQWMPLWEDVRASADDILASATHGEGLTEHQSHFMGAVVLQQLATGTGSLQRRIVVDGQQRLITLQLLLRAAREVLEARGINGPAARLEDLVLNQPKYQGGEADNAYKVWPTDTDREAFRCAMGNGSSGERLELRIVDARDFFKDQIRQWLDDGEGQDRSAEEMAKALEDALSRLLELVVIDLRASDDPYIIFETLNARGTPLRQSDLVKNLILHRAHSAGVDNEVEWPFSGPWWDEDIPQGRLYRSRIDVFLNYWLVMRSRREVGATDVSSSFRRLIQSGRHGEITEIASELAEGGTDYRCLEGQESGLAAYWTEFSARWKTMQAAVTTPVLLWLLRCRSQAEPGQVSMALKALESYLVRRMVCRMNARGYNRVVIDLVRRLQDKGPATAGDTVIEFLGEKEAWGTLWPSDNRVLDAITNKPLYRLLRRDRLRLVLEVIELRLRTCFTEHELEPFQSKALTIEHIMPQSWRGSWPAPEPWHQLGAIPENPEERRDRLLDSLGNLTLVTRPLNSALSNGPWHDKREALNEHSTLFLNKDLLRHPGPDRWDEEAIHARARRLHEAFVKAWPHYADADRPYVSFNAE